MAGLRGSRLSAIVLSIGLAAFIVSLGSGVHATAISFVHIATSANTTGSKTEIDHAAANNNAAAMLLVTHNLSPHGVPGSVNDHPIGVGYDGGTGHWVILNQDSANMPIGAAFNVRVADSGSTTALVHETSSANCNVNVTWISHSAADGHPNVLVLATPRLKLTNPQTVYNSHPTGVYYITDQAKWAIYNERLNNGKYTSALAMPTGIGFNVEVRERSPQSAFLHVANASNAPTTMPSYRQTYTIIDHPLTNGNPQAILFVAHNYSPPDQRSGPYLNSPLAVNYLPVEQKWAIVLTGADLGSATPFTDSPWGATAAFNVLVTAAEAPGESAGASPQGSSPPTEPTGEQEVAARIFTGESDTGSFIAALADALEQLAAALGSDGTADAQATWEVVDISGVFGGYSGSEVVRVTIRATRSPSW